jgi:hypothetical protein
MAGLRPGALMQRAATGLATICLELLGRAHGVRVVLLVGSGDNGGDALFDGAVLSARGARVTAVAGDVLYYDGRATKEENFRERTGIARRGSDGWRRGEQPVADVRYLDVLGGRLFYEAARPDGAHELRTETAG